MFGIKMKLKTRHKFMELKYIYRNDTLESVVLIVVVNCDDFERCHNEKHSSMN